MRRIISRSAWRSLLATFIAMTAFVLLYEATMFDSRDAARADTLDPTAPKAGARLTFSATAYCKGTTTASGTAVRTGIAAADAVILPVGSVINVTTDDTKYNGIYTIMDTGPKVQGRILDVYIWSCNEALAFGRKQVQITVLRLGWNPSNSSPSLIDRLFRRREAARNAVPPPPTNPAANVAPAVIDGSSDGTPLPQEFVPSDGVPTPPPTATPSSGATVPPVAPASEAR